MVVVANALLALSGLLLVPAIRALVKFCSASRDAEAQEQRFRAMDDEETSASYRDQYLMLAAYSRSAGYVQEAVMYLTLALILLTAALLLQAY